MVDFGEITLRESPGSVEELSILSLDAAIELDRFRTGHPVDKDVIRNLVDKLRFQKGGAKSVELLQNLADPNSIDIFNRAVFHLTKVQSNTMDDLAAQVEKFIEGFTRDIDDLAKDDLVQMRDFCLALHKELLAELFERNNEVAVDVV